MVKETGKRNLHPGQLVRIKEMRTSLKIEEVMVIRHSALERYAVWRYPGLIAIVDFMDFEVVAPISFPQDIGSPKLIRWEKERGGGFIFFTYEGRCESLGVSWMPDWPVPNACKVAALHHESGPMVKIDRAGVSNPEHYRFSCGPNGRRGEGWRGVFTEPRGKFLPLLPGGSAYLGPFALVPSATGPEIYSSANYGDTIVLLGLSDPEEVLRYLGARADWESWEPSAEWEATAAEGEPPSPERENSPSGQSEKCDVCNLWLNSHFQYLEHLKGDRHRKLVAGREKALLGPTGRARLIAALNQPGSDDDSDDDQKCAYRFDPRPGSELVSEGQTVCWKEAVAGADDLWETWRGGPGPVGANGFIWRWCPDHSQDLHRPSASPGFNRRRPVVLCVNDVLAADARRGTGVDRRTRVNTALQKQCTRSSTLCEHLRALNLRGGMLDRLDSVDRVLGQLIVQTEWRCVRRDSERATLAHPSISFKKYVDGCRLRPIADFPVQGSRVAKWSLEQFINHGDGALGRHLGFAHGVGLGHNHCDILLHAGLSRMLELAVVEDKLDVVNLSCFEVLLRMMGVVELHHEKAGDEGGSSSGDLEPSGSRIFGQASCLVPPELDAIWRGCKVHISGHTPELIARISEQYILA